jgi:hypothetical protein
MLKKTQIVFVDCKRSGSGTGPHSCRAIGIVVPKIFAAAVQIEVMGVGMRPVSCSGIGIVVPTTPRLALKSELNG